MGGCGAACEPRCPNLAKSWQLGWHTLRQFDQDNLPIGFWYNTSIAGQTLSQVRPGDYGGSCDASVGQRAGRGCSPGAWACSYEPGCRAA
jgi:hypothetical protein